MPIVFIVRRNSPPEDNTCTFVAVSCKPSGLVHHAAHATPPKIKFETCLELRNVRLARLLDGGFWTVLWYAARPSCPACTLGNTPLTACLFWRCGPAQRAHLATHRSPPAFFGRYAAMQSPDDDDDDHALRRHSPMDILYQILMPFLTEDSLDVALAKTAKARRRPSSAAAASFGGLRAAAGGLRSATLFDTRQAQVARSCPPVRACSGQLSRS